ncbi:MAG: hypothetical protein HY690_09100 [Chloroflexi bacterium]|nr:hypothetical protein [Chloroflexota bacterium]
MATSPSWPTYEADELTLGNPESGAGVCCLWTDRRRLVGGLDASRYAALGNLYSSGGLGLLARNLLANPRLRYLVGCGTDLSGSGAALVALFQRGLDQDHHIAGTEVQFDRRVPAEAVEALRARVQVVDLRGVSAPEQIDATLQALPPLPPLGEPRLFPEEVPDVETLPSEGAGYLVRQTLIARAWLESLELAITFGEPGQDEGGRPLRALLDLVAIVSEPVDRLHVPSWLPLERAEVERFADELWTGRSRYGQRLRQGAAGDQLADLARRLGEAPASTRAVAVVWEPRQDAAAASPPRLCLLSGVLRGGRLALTAFFRSHDLGRAWPLNVFGLRLVQGRLAEELGTPCGPLVVVSQSAHLYRAAEPPLRELVAEHAPRLLPWQADPRGIFHIRLADGQIQVEHGLQDAGKSGRRFSGTSAERLSKAVVHAKLVLLPEHAAYLGAELQKAEVALRLGIPYRQDEPLELPRVGG